MSTSLPVFHVAAGDLFLSRRENLNRRQVQVMMSHSHRDIWWRMGKHPEGVKGAVAEFKHVVWVSSLSLSGREIETKEGENKCQEEEQETN